MKYLFLIITILSGAVLIFYSQIGIDKSMAVVAEVEPQKTAISFPKSVRIKSIYVSPGQSVKKGDLLLEVDRPDLILEIDKAENDISRVNSQLEEALSNKKAKRELLRLHYIRDTTSINQERRLLSQQIKSDTSVYRPLNIKSRPSEQYKISMEALAQEELLTEQTYNSELGQIEIEYRQDNEQLLLSKSRLEAELLSLQNEKSALKQYAPFSGIIGSAVVQLQELIPPYKTIISIYEEHPTIIKAYLNELAEVEVALGQSVKVTSINRNYEVQGKVVEIGSRIVSYPKQMKSGISQEMWGKEIFVEINENNTFLSGEKVYVVINKKGS